MHPLRLLLLPLAISSIPVLVLADPDAGQPAPLKSEWFTASEVAADTWCIVDHGVVNSYLVLGHERALLIDVGYGHANLRDYVGSLTKLPLTVINTHGHRDHSGADVQFGAVLAPPADFPMIEHNALPEQRERNRETLNGAVVPAGELFPYDTEAKPLALKAVKEGDIIELGGRRLEVIEVP